MSGGGRVRRVSCGLKKGQILVGCCGFPEARVKYFAEFDAVEVQQTFYDLPQVSTVQRWREEAGHEFHFTMKAWQAITHLPTSPTYRKLKREIPARQRKQFGAFRPNRVRLDAWRQTAEVALAMNAEIVLFQCPASFRPIEENLRNMRRFFASVERHGLLFVWEPRGGNWTPTLIQSLCRELDLVHATDPFTMPSCTPGLLYFRLHGIGSIRYQYTDEDLSHLQAETAAGPGYVFFNNVPMLNDARRFRKLIAPSRSNATGHPQH